MNYEYSAGAVVYIEIDGLRHYVIIRSKEGICGFPKGHLEKGETERQAALREIREETGLAVTLRKGFRAVDEYPLPYRKDTRKRVTYFLADYKDQTPIPQEEEVSDIRLLPFDQAVKTLPFPAARRILREADTFLQNERNKT